MSVPLDRKSPARFAHAVSVRAAGGDWSLLVTAADPVETVASEVAANLAEYLDVPEVPILKVESASALFQALETRGAGHAIVVADAWDEATWRAVDRQRARLPQRRVLVFMLTAAHAERLVAFAPNLASMLDATTSECGPDESLISADERDARLEVLRRKLGRTDAEVVTLAERKHLPSDPEYAEWLPGTDAWSIPTPIFSPDELLDLLIWRSFGSRHAEAHTP